MSHATIPTIERKEQADDEALDALLQRLAEWLADVAEESVTHD